MNDHTNGTHYPLDLPPEGWAWEFLRRNPLYHQDYKKWLDLEPYVTSKYSPAWLETPARQEDRKATMYEPERGPNETFLEWQHRCQATGVEPQTLPISVGLARKWLLECLVDPTASYGPQIRFRKPEFPIQVTWDDVETYFLSCSDEGAPQALPDPRHPLMAFDVQQPPGPQLERARVMLKQLAAVNGSAKKQAAKVYWRPDGWPDQLYVFDRRSAGESLKDIASVLFPEENRDPICGPEHYAKRASDMYYAACKMIDSGYRGIIGK